MKRPCINIFNGLILLVCTGLAGCVTIGSVEKNYSKVYTPNGINEKEAVWISQKYCIESQDCKGRVRLSAVEIENDLNGNWDVYLRAKTIRMFNKPYIVKVDEETGEVVSAGFNISESEN